MFTALHPWLLWGTAAVAVPVLIHLLLRQRPRPRPWAAMRWLLAAARAAQRRYRLTNLLLLLLRCLIVLLVALAVVRPSIAGIGGGERLVVVVDRTASLGPRGAEPGPLAAAKAALLRAELPYRAVVVAAVADEVEVVADGSPAAALEALGRLEASELPGGLDRAATGPLAERLAALIGAAADVVLVSDFQQDHGERLAALLRPRCRSLARWGVGRPCANALVGGVEDQGDLLPGRPGELTVRVVGAIRGATMAVDDGAFLAAAEAGPGGALRLATPPLPAGDHLLHLRLEDEALAYDNRLDLPVTVRPAVSVLAVQEGADFLGAALAADTNTLAFHAVRPSQFGDEPLPARGLVALRAPMNDGPRLAEWVLGGGVVWAQLAALREDQALRGLVAGLAATGRPVPGGPFASGEQDVDEVLGLARRETVPGFTLPPRAEPVLRAGAAPLVVAVPAGRGWAIVELDDLAGDAVFQSRGTTPLWVSRVARRYTARLDAPRFWQAGLPAAEAISLRRGGLAAALKPGDPLLLAPGVWQVEGGGALVVLPNREEGRLSQVLPAGCVARLDAALPRRPGLDWGLPLAFAALLVALGEGLLAAWAGRTYGR